MYQPIERTFRNVGTPLMRAYCVEREVFLSLFLGLDRGNPPATGLKTFAC
jgi:hypothetical protein